MPKEKFLRQLVSGDTVQATLEGHPVDEFVGRLKGNFREGGKLLGREMVQTIKQRLNRGGVKGQTYDPQYALRKSKETGWSPTDGVDLQYSGTLLRNLTSESNIDRKRGRMTVGLTVKSETRPTSISNTRLANILNGNPTTRASKVGTDGPPLALHSDEETEIVNKVARQLAGRD